MKTAAIVFALAGMLHAGEVKLAWNPQADATSFRIWLGIECLATVSEPRATVTLPDAPAVITVTARNAAGESAHSDPLELIALPLEESTDLKSWKIARFIHRERVKVIFYRLQAPKVSTP